MTLAVFILLIWLACEGHWGKFVFVLFFVHVW